MIPAPLQLHGSARTVSKKSLACNACRARIAARVWKSEPAEESLPSVDARPLGPEWARSGWALMAESGLSAFGLLIGKADADLGTTLGSV